MKTRSVKITGAILSLCLIFTSFAACGSPVSDTSDPLPEHYGSALWDAEEIFTHPSYSFSADDTEPEPDSSLILPRCAAVNGNDVYVFDSKSERLAVFRDGRLSYKTEGWSDTDTMCVHGGKLYAFDRWENSIRVYDLDGDPAGALTIEGLTGLNVFRFDGPPAYTQTTLFSDGTELKLMNDSGDIFRFDFERDMWLKAFSVSVENIYGSQKTVVAGDLRFKLMLGKNTEVMYYRNTADTVTVGVKRYDRQGSLSYDYSLRVYDISGELISCTTLCRYDEAAVDAALESGDLSGIHGAEVYIDSNGEPYALIFENGIFRVTKPNMRPSLEYTEQAAPSP